MNTALVTTGLSPLTIGSVERFEISPTIDSLPWNLLGASVVDLLFADPNGVQTTFHATLGAPDSAGNIYSAFVNYRIVNPAGLWVRAWHVIDAAGVEQFSRPIVFTVISSPV